MADISKIVNTNDNIERKFSYFKGLYFTGENKENWIKYIPLINYLFATYSKQYWKNDPSHMDYAFTEYQLCTCIKRIDEPNFSADNRKHLIESIACILEVSPLLLYNDTNLPF
jgi:hypothetical protein